MRSRDYSIATAHAKPLRDRVLVVLLLAAGLTLLILAHGKHASVNQVRAAVMGVVTPVLELVASPASAMQHATADIRSFFATYAENKKLKSENEALRHWQETAQALKAENEALRHLMEYKPVEQVSYVTARVLATSRGDFSQSLTLNVGSDLGVTNLAPVVDAYGVIGRVVDVTPESARVLLLTDVASRLPVVTGTTRQRAILTGTGGELMRLRYLSANTSLTLGETVTTTQEGGLVPGGMAVGTVFRQDESGYLVKPLRSLTRAEYVRVVNWRDGVRAE